MGIWRKFFRESAQGDGPVDDAGLLTRSLSFLAEHGFHPAREITLGQLSAASVGGLLAFRRRPLTTLLTLPDADGRILFDRVYVDNDDLNRVSVDDLVFFTEEAAQYAGTGALLRDILVMCDPGSSRKGSLRYTIGHDVRDHSFELDPGFGDQMVEAEILDGVSPHGHEAFTFYARPSMQRVTLWLTIASDDKLVDALSAENTEDTKNH